MILFDTGPLVALCEPRDALNRTALRDLDRAYREPQLASERRAIPGPGRYRYFKSCG